MMSFDERLGWLLLGMALGYIIRTLQDIRKEGHEVHRIVKRERDEGGFMRYPLVADIALLLVIAMTVYASFSTQITNNKLEDAIHDIEAGQAQDKETRTRLARITVCSQQYLAKTIEALNQRTEFTQEQANANVQLQQAQRDFLEIIMKQPPPSDREAREALAAYVDTLRAFVDVSGKARDKTDKYEYPTSEELESCLNTNL